MHILTDSLSGTKRADTLLVLLPPAEARVEDFYTQGFVDAVRHAGIPADLVLAEVTTEHVMAKTVVSSLRERVVQPAQFAGYREIWFAGISLGAFNALHYAAEHASHLAGIHLMAPYPGTGDILAEIIDAGGPAAWARTRLCEQGDERVWWRWLCREAKAGQWQTPVFLSTGNEDRFLRGQHMLASLLPPERVRYMPGAHAWPTWKRLWQDWLEQGPLASLSLRTCGEC